MLKMPTPDAQALRDFPAALSAFRKVLPAHSIVSTRPELRAYECDALTAYRQTPLAVLLPENTAQVAQVLRICADRRINIVPRGAGTSLSGGALPVADGVVVGLSKLSRILDVDYANRTVTAQSGVSNLAITHAVQSNGFFYAPDPSSQIVCTIGGNVAENSGGVHCLKYGLTTHNVLGVEMVLPDGEVLRLGGKHLEHETYDLLGVVTGSEGLLGIVTEVTVRILPKPQCAAALLAAFDSIEAAGACVASIIARGIIPAGMEIMDRLATHAAEDYCAPGYPRGAQAVLLLEVDGCESEVTEEIAGIRAAANECGATGITEAADDAARARMWAGRKAAFPAIGRLAPDYYCMDGTIPRRELPAVLGRIRELSREFGLEVANVFHAGDGNLHPLILYDANVPGQLERAEELGAEILELCVAHGGVLTGEHGVGVEKRDLMGTMFSEIDLAQQQRLKCAFDVDGRFNPGKVFPVLHRCAELGRVHVHAGQTRFPELPRY